MDFCAQEMKKRTDEEDDAEKDRFAQAAEEGDVSR